MNDLVSRQAAIDALGEEPPVWYDGEDEIAERNQWKRDIEAIKQLPPIQPKRGRWIKLDMHRGMADHKCTACKQECYVPTCMGEPMYAFCPNCGADMIERKERTVRAIDADALQRAIVEEGQANKRKKYVIGDIWELTGAEIRDVINSQPTIQPEPHWIPVDLENNEPQLEEWVLVSSDGYVMQDCIVERGGKKIWYHGGNIQADDRYMPLPEPYKGVTE